MDPTTQQRIASYRGILDQADGLIARWFAAAQATPDPPDPAPLSTMVLTLRRAIDTRQKLDLWEHPPRKLSRYGFHDPIFGGGNDFDDDNDDGDNNLSDNDASPSPSNATPHVPITPASSPSSNVGSALLRGETPSNDLPPTPTPTPTSLPHSHSTPRLIPESQRDAIIAAPDAGPEHPRPLPQLRSPMGIRAPRPPPVPPF